MRTMMRTNKGQSEGGGRDADAGWDANGAESGMPFPLHGTLDGPLNIESSDAKFRASDPHPDPPHCA